MVKKEWLWLMSLAGLGLFFYCAFFYMNSNHTVSQQWGRYINPINQIYFFIFGVVAARLLLPYVGGCKIILSAAILACFIIMAIYPVYGDQIHIVTGMNKIFFTVIIVILSSAFFLLRDLNNVRILHVTLKFLGDISYTIYLLHGVALMYFQKTVMPNLNSHAAKGIAIMALIAILMLASWVCHIYIEKPIVALGKKFTMMRISEGAAAKTQ
ncbi:acyltransferase [Edwardsiella ictaluri]|uniref:acyltransferase family protein n=1 Tax=Edwardsiella ictaluri TaxID=67780 RepID=UPI0009BD2284|nr:acyltransferase family protein [Edwardsiella ictaluri]ARD39228.1 hypothetical protein B6E78_07400 [Edwardsiella ictaluri]QPW27656.1 acyltransferase [Edwardsiella ictaluri]